MSRKTFLMFFIFGGLSIFFVVTSFAEISLSEVQIEPTTDQWVELYNSGSEVVDLSNWIIDDSGGSEKLVIDLNTKIASSSLMSFKSTKLNLNKTGGDILRLFNKDNALVESFSYSDSPGNNLTYGKNLGSWFICQPTFNENNNCFSPTPTATLTPSETLTPTNSPTSSPTSTITVTIKPSPTTKQTLTSTSTHSPTPIIFDENITDSFSNKLVDEELLDAIDIVDANEASESSIAGEVLSSTVSSEIILSSSPKSQKEVERKNYYILIILLGLIFIASAVYLFYTAKQHE